LKELCRSVIDQAINQERADCGKKALGLNQLYKHERPDWWPLDTFTSKDVFKNKDNLHAVYNAARKALGRMKDVEIEED